MGCSWFLVSTQKLAWFLKAWKISSEDWSKERSFHTELGCYVIFFVGLSAPLLRTIREKHLRACRLCREAAPRNPPRVHAPTRLPTSSTPAPLPVASPHTETNSPSSLVLPQPSHGGRNTFPHQIRHPLTRVQWRTSQGRRRRRASPPPRPSFPRRRPRRRPSPSFFFFTKPSRMNSSRSTPTLLYSNKWPIARALLVAGELPLPIISLPLP